MALSPYQILVNILSLALIIFVGSVWNEKTLHSICYLLLKGNLGFILLTFFGYVWNEKNFKQKIMLHLKSFQKKVCISGKLSGP